MLFFPVGKCTKHCSWKGKRETLLPTNICVVVVRRRTLRMCCHSIRTVTWQPGGLQRKYLLMDFCSRSGWIRTSWFSNLPSFEFLEVMVSMIACLFASHFWWCHGGTWQGCCGFVCKCVIVPLLASPRFCFFLFNGFQEAISTAQLGHGMFRCLFSHRVKKKTLTN